MKATELRVGNLLDYKNGNITTMVVEDFAEIAHNDDFLKLITPIPLTDEWLVKLGFEKKDRSYYYDDIFSVYIEGRIQVSWDEHPITYIEHVHQLQNIYFALTGEELNSSQ